MNAVEPTVRRFPLAYTVCTPDCAAPNPMAYDQPFAVALQELADIGYDGVELQVRDATVIDPGRLAAQLRSHDLRVAALATGHVRSESGLQLADADGSRRSRAVRAVAAVVDLAAELETMITIGSVRGGPRPDDRDGLLAVRTSLEELAGHAADTKVKIVIEPQHRHVGPYLNTTRSVVELIDDAGWTHVGVVADTFHMNIEERSLPGGLLRAGDRLWHVQLGENDRSALGGGSLPLGTVLDTLDAIDYRGWLTMEHAQGSGSGDAARRSLAAVDVYAPDGRGA